MIFLAINIYEFIVEYALLNNVLLKIRLPFMINLLS